MVSHLFLVRLSLLVHCGPRAFKDKSFIGPWLQSTGLNIVAGCTSSVSITRCILYNVVSEMDLNYPPIQTTTWVDDCPQLHVGPEAFLASRAPVAATAFAKKCMMLALRFLTQLLSFLLPCNWPLTFKISCARQAFSSSRPLLGEMWVATWLAALDAESLCKNTALP